LIYVRRRYGLRAGIYWRRWPEAGYAASCSDEMNIVQKSREGSANGLFLFYLFLFAGYIQHGLYRRKALEKRKGGREVLKEHASGAPSVARQLCTGGPMDGHAESLCSAFSFHHLADSMRTKSLTVLFGTQYVRIFAKVRNIIRHRKHYQQYNKLITLYITN